MTHNGKSPLFSARPGGGKLLRRTFIISLMLVSVGLITSGAVELYFRYRESTAAVEELQREMAQGAAFKINQFVQDIAQTMRAATQTQGIVGTGLTDAYRFDLFKLLKISPAITEAVAVQPDGRELIKVSRVRTTLPDDLKDRSADVAFIRAREGKPYFGEVYFVRKSEPYMTIAVPMERFAGEVTGVLIGEVNLKYIWDVVSAIKVGKAGYAYVVSGTGDLIAHPDISFVLERRNLNELEQVKAALAKRSGLLDPQPNLSGQKVFAAHAPIPDLGWAVLIERPVSEAYAPLYASTLRTSLLLLLGLAMAILASVLIGRRVLRPVGILREGAARIGSGDLDHRLEIETGDELQALAEEFNNMARRLKESYANLEQKVEDRTRELTESLEQQTATSEILGVIASSPTDVQPVLDAVATRAARLCAASDALICRIDGESLKVVSHHGDIAAPDVELPMSRTLPVGRSVIDRQSIHILDVAAEIEGEYPGAMAPQRMSGTRTLLAAPLLREGTAIGAIVVRRTEVRPFSEKQISLLKTFADQAVIAIENVRLFQELQVRNRALTEALDQQTATSQVLSVIAQSPTDLNPVYQTILASVTRLCECNIAALFLYDGETLSTAASHGTTQEFAEHLQSSRPRPSRETTTRLAALERTTVHVTDLLADARFAPKPRELYEKENVRTVLSVPMLREGQLVGVITSWRREVRPFSAEQIALVKTFADQAVIAIENVRLFKELEEKNDLLEAANKHKSQFLANVSHELRTPLNSIIGFTRLVMRKTEGQIEKLQKDNLQKVLISSEHLLNLINGLLDLAKIEAGRMEAYAEVFKLDDIVRVATATVEPLLKTGQVKLITDIAPDIPPLKTDREKLKQSVLNLLSNAVKFTEKGEIKVAAWRDNGNLKMTISDTGIGMKKEALDLIFEEFRQADMSSTRRYGGTGLGLAIVRKFIHLLGGEIAVESEEGKGSKFTMTIPMELKQ